MTRLNAILFLLLLGSSLLLVKTAYEARQLFAAIDQAQDDHARLDAEYKRLDAERRAQATSLRVESTARDRLQMRNATPGVTFYVFDGPRASGGAEPERSALSGAVAGTRP
jgi:cell division protein FtsL